MKSLVFLSVPILVFLGCSHGRFVLQDPARGGSVGDRPVEVTFRADEGADITVNPAAAPEERYLLASSRELETLADTVHNEPAVALLFAAMKETRVEKRDLRPPSFPERLGRVPRWSLQGALGGLDTIGSLFAPRRYAEPDWDLLPADPDDREFLMAASVVGGIGGAVLYPLARLFCPESRKMRRSYRNNGD